MPQIGAADRTPRLAATRWTTADIPPQTGRLAIVTGATSGIGYESARALARSGAMVVIAARDAAKAARVMATIRQTVPEAKLEAWPLDTASLASVRAFSARWREHDRPIDVLLLNAGISWVPRREESDDGFERQLATNYLGHFALAGLLLPSLRPGPASRIVSVASLAHRRGRLHLDDLQLCHGYEAQGAYRQSKLAMLMFGLELDRKLRAAGSKIRAIPVHPGWAVTDIFRRGERASTFQRLVGSLIFRVLGQSAAQGALPLLYAATSLEAQSGVYYGPDDAREATGYPAKAKVEPHALDEATAVLLWALSEELTGVRFAL